jgi:hypothetical protein
LNSHILERDAGRANGHRRELRKTETEQGA